MSRVGRSPIPVPGGVQLSLKGQCVEGESPQGSFSLILPEGMTATYAEAHLSLAIPDKENSRMRALWGTLRSLIAGYIAGLEKPFLRRIDLVGVGYKANIQGKNIVLSLGYSHDIIVPIPEEIKIVCEKPTTLAISGANKQRVGQIVRELQKYRPPEPYKGKGMIREGQYVLRKEGKKK
ncbi:MAG: 50S ribosomal protein L6 [Holosporales bacterium]|jgi:large subunit ribosomal protein L6|nr:50S ribosomal protein L6 [Holosporales bacterium]